jgi:hypothetical protein
VPSGPHLDEPAVKRPPADDTLQRRHRMADLAPPKRRTPFGEAVYGVEDYPNQN